MRITKSVMAALASTTCIVAFATSAAAQAQSFEIPAGDMRGALTTFAQQSGVEMVYRIDQLGDARSPGVSGTMTADDALTRLLAGSGLQGRRDPSGAIAIVPAKPSVQPIAWRQPEGTAYAQATQDAPPAPLPAPRADQLDEIVVTAQRRAENMQDVPIAVTAITGDALQVGGVNASVDLPRIVPGLVMHQVGTSFLPYIRGVGSNQSGGGNESPVAVYIDGVYQGAKAGNLTDLSNIERIEVLKGPQGTLFGRNANGGAINIVTRDPGADPEFAGEFGYGRFDERRMRLYASAPVADNLRASLAFSGRWSDGYIHNIGLNLDANPTKNIVVMGKIVWEPTDRLTAKLSGSYSHQSDPTNVTYHSTPETIPLGVVTAGSFTTYDPRENVSNIPTYIRTDTTRAALDLRYDLDSVELVSITGYTDARAFVGSDTDVTMAPLNGSGLGQPGEQFTQEFQIQSQGDGPLTWIGGVHYMWLKEGQGNPPHNFTIALNAPFPVAPADLLEPGAFAQGFSSLGETNAGAVFGQASYKFTEQTQLTLGLRYTKEKKSVNGRSWRYIAAPADGMPRQHYYGTTYRNDGLVFDTVPLQSMDLSKTWSKMTWRVALDHKFTDDILGYLSYNRGFKSGSFVTGNVNPNQIPVDPEVLDAFEAGLKTELFDNRLRFNIAAFYYDYKDIQVSFLTELNTAQLQNAAGARLYGVDIDFLARPTRSLTLRGGLNWLDSKYKNFDRAQITLPNIQGVPCPAVAQVVTPQQAQAIAAGVPTGGGCNYALNAKGQDVLFAAKLTGNIGLDYEFDFASGSRILASTTLSYNDGYDILPGGFFGRVGSHETLSASLTWYAPDDKYFIRAWGENLTNDTHAINYASSVFAFQEVSSKPISYGVTVGFNFGGQ